MVPPSGERRQLVPAKGICYLVATTPLPIISDSAPLWGSVASVVPHLFTNGLNVLVSEPLFDNPPPVVLDVAPLWRRRGAGGRVVAMLSNQHSPENGILINVIFGQVLRCLRHSLEISQF